MFHNSLSLASILKINRKDINAICKKMLPFLQVEKHFQIYEISKSLNYFIHNNADLIDNSHLQGFLLYAFGPNRNEHEELIFTLFNIPKKEPLELHVNRDQWESLQSSYLINENLYKGQGMLNDICILYKVLPVQSYKDEIMKFLKYNLTAKFSGSIYYQATINEIIKPVRCFTSKYESEIINLASEGRHPLLFERGFYYDHRIDEFINFSFCFKLSLNLALVREIEKLDTYYKWITNIEAFDYDHFEPDWLFVHLTKYYREHFMLSKSLKAWLRNYTLKSNDHRVVKLFIDIYSM